MSVAIRTNNSIFEIGTSDLLISFFDTVELRLSKGIFGKKFPFVLNEFYHGELQNQNIDKAVKELQKIQKGLKKYPPSKLIWDKEDLNKKPPWGDDISSDIKDLSMYWVTSDGKDLFEVLFEALSVAKKEGSNLVIR